MERQQFSAEEMNRLSDSIRQTMDVLRRIAPHLGQQGYGYGQYQQQLPLFQQQMGGMGGPNLDRIADAVRERVHEAARERVADAIRERVGEAVRERVMEAIRNVGGQQFGQFGGQFGYGGGGEWI